MFKRYLCFLDAAELAERHSEPSIRGREIRKRPEHIIGCLDAFFIGMQKIIGGRNLSEAVR